MRMLANASWLTTARIAGDILSLFLFIVLSRYFGPGGIGQYAYGLAIAGFAYSAINLGFEDYAIRECARLPLKGRRSLIGQLVGIQLGSMICVAVVLIGLLLVIKPSTEKSIIILLLSAQQLTFALTRTFFAPAFAQERMSGPAIAELLCRAGVIFSVITLAGVLRTSLEIALIPYPVGGLVLLAIAITSARHYLNKLRLSVTWDEGIKIVRSAWPFAASLFLFYLRSRGSLIIIALLLGDDMTGIYASSLKFLEFSIIPLTFVGLAAYPNLSLLFQGDDQSFQETADRLLRVALMLGALATWALVFLVPTVVIPLLGEKFLPAIPVIRIMAIIGIFSPVGITMVRLLLAMNLQVKRLKISLLSIVLNFLLTLALLPILSVIGAAVAWIIAIAVSNILFLKAVQRKVAATVLMRTVLSFFSLALPAFLVAALFTWLTPYTWLPAAASLATFGAALIGTGFLPLPKTIKSPGIIGSKLSRRS